MMDLLYLCLSQLLFLDFQYGALSFHVGSAAVGDDHATQVLSILRVYLSLLCLFCLYERIDSL